MLADDLGWLDVGFHGSKINTPTIDSLAKEGVILDNYYVQPLCTPARGALMTGRYPIHTGLQHDVIHPTNPFGLPLDFQTLPERLKKAGYATHLVGKWHLGFYKWPYVPTNRGFDSAFGYLDGAEDHYDHKVSNVVDFRNGTEPVLDLNGKYATFEFVKRIEEILDQHDPKQPLFLYMAFQNVHNPIQAPDQLWENTCTVFSTDNGGEPVFGGYNWPLRGTKHTLWEGGVRGAAFVHGKMLEKTGVKCEELLHISDFFPTLINLADGSFDAKHPIPIDGFDVWNTLSRGEASPRTEILLNINSPPPGTSSSRVNRPGMALRKGSMKLLMNVKNITWFKPPELRGVPADVLVSRGFLKDETDEEILEQC
ncbi:Arylsulfatase B [Stylophora pistillata]|uniref:Arylsulfatase B n=1 Tax=Stylophora pistillata TaxID=50429 RepID=A0A2B4T1P6_STYPI|nr:Arylsulfatase B [Stylophora pistillata]